MPRRAVREGPIFVRQLSYWVLLVVSRPTSLREPFAGWEGLNEVRNHVCSIRWTLAADGVATPGRDA